MNSGALIVRQQSSRHETIVHTHLDDMPLVAAIERFVAREGGTLFHRPAWLLAVERGTGQRAHGLVCWRRGAAAEEPELCGWLPLTQVHSSIFGRRLISSGFGVEGGALASDPSGAQMLARASVELAQRLSCSLVELRGGSAPHGWTLIADKHSTFSADLAASDADQMALVPRKQRAELRKALAQDFTVSIGRDCAALNAFYGVYAQSVHRLGTPVFPKALLSAALEALDADVLTVSWLGKPVASVLSFYHRGTVMPYWGGGTPQARVLRANDRLYFELMRHARRRGCTRFDFGRSKLGSGAWAYKRNWGFVPRPLTYARCACDGAHLPDVDPVNRRYARSIALWKQLPLAVANRFGPLLARGLA